MSAIMGGVVKEICDSMKNNPNRWEITTYTLNDKKSGLRYWLGLGDTEITKTWNGRSNDTVFTCTQGQEIFQAYLLMREYKASAAQEKVLASFKGKQTTKDKSWWEFWK